MRQADAALYRAMWELAMDDVLEVSHRMHHGCSQSRRQALAPGAIFINKCSRKPPGYT